MAVRRAISLAMVKWIGTADFEYEETINKSRALIRAAELAIDENS